jgi:general stress protein 26
MAEDDLDTFWSLIDDIPISMMTSREGGSLRARPMGAKIDKTTHEFRFLTRLSSHNTDELAANAEVNLAFCDPVAGNFVSISGQAYLTQDRKLIDQLWDAESDTFLRCGRDDADVAVIRVVPSRAEYWGADGSLRHSWNVFKPKHAESEPDLSRGRKLATG